MKKWKYYNHAAIPTTAPHEEVDLSPINNGSIWKMPGHPFFARWTSDFDCGTETNWWYIIKDHPIELEELSSHSRKHIRQGVRKTDIKIINSETYTEELYEVSSLAFSKYKNASNEISKEKFIEECSNKDNKIYWAGFEKESKRLIGYLVIRVNFEYIEIVTAKFDPNYLNTHISDALYYTVINYYLVDEKYKYVSSGQRNINHDTNTQDYKENTLGYRKAYCKLHIKYRFPFGIIIMCLYPFRRVLHKFSDRRLIHQILGILQMEEICSTQ